MQTSNIYFYFSHGSTRQTLRLLFLYLHNYFFIFYKSPFSVSKKFRIVSPNPMRAQRIINNFNTGNFLNNILKNTEFTAPILIDIQVEATEFYVGFYRTRNNSIPSKKYFYSNNDIPKKIINIIAAYVFTARYMQIPNIHRTKNRDIFPSQLYCSMCAHCVLGAFTSKGRFLVKFLSSISSTKTISFVSFMGFEKLL